MSDLVSVECPNCETSETVGIPPTNRINFTASVTVERIQCDCGYLTPPGVSHD